jgi:hypothetical protein
MNIRTWNGWVSSTCGETFNSVFSRTPKNLRHFEKESLLALTHKSLDRKENRFFEQSWWEIKTWIRKYLFHCEIFLFLWNGEEDPYYLTQFCGTELDSCVIVMVVWETFKPNSSLSTKRCPASAVSSASALLRYHVSSRPPWWALLCPRTIGSK